MKSPVLHFVLAATVLTAALLGSENVCHARFVQFDDTVNYWDTWQASVSSNNSDDVIGIPQITGGSLNIVDGYLSNVSFSFNNSKNFFVDVGDLFIDIGSNGYWDYVVDVDNYTNTIQDSSWNGTSWGGFTPDTSGVLYTFDDQAFGVAKGQNDSFYDISSDLWTINGVRNDHPMAYNNTDLGLVGDESVDVSGTFSRQYNQAHSIDFVFFDPTDYNPTDRLVHVGTSGLTVGFAAACANDVIMAGIEAVPEPTIVLLLGSAMAGLSGANFLKRRKNKKSFLGKWFGA